MVNKYPQILTYSIEDNLAPTIDFFEFGMGEVKVSGKTRAALTCLRVPCFSFCAATFASPVILAACRGEGPQSWLAARVASRGGRRERDGRRRRQSGFRLGWEKPTTDTQRGCTLFFLRKVGHGFS